MNTKKNKLNIFSFVLLTIVQSLLLGAIFISPMTTYANTVDNFYVSTNYAIPSGNNLVLRGRVSYPPKNTVTWFKWGETPYMEYSTTPVGLSYISYAREINLSKKIFNVKKNTTYYYQLVTKTIDGNRKYGERLSTTTGWDGIDSFANTEASNTNTNTNYTDTVSTKYYNYNITNTTSKTSPIVITLISSFVTSDTAKLKGLALPGSTIKTEGWFEFGKTQTLGKQTLHRNVSNDTRSITFWDTITKLSPNTIYYYRAVITNVNGTSYGNILKIRTNKQYIIKKQIQVAHQKSTKVKKEQVAIKKSTLAKSSLASTIASNSSKFMPNTLLEWMILLLVILILLILSDHLYATRAKRKKESNDK